MISLLNKTLNDRYRVEELIGRGGMADVYRVYDLQRCVPLAMKVLRDDLSEDRVFMRRFQREAHNLASLQHPNIVRFYGLEQCDEAAFILMDYIEGPTLRKVIHDARGPLEVDQVLAILQPVCSALYYAHRQGIVHCDLKSANILIDKGGRVYLTDFGIARMADAATSTLIGAGTPAYMAPELILGQDPTPQSDIYSLGIVLFEMLTGGERPFTGEQAETTGTTAEKVRWEQLHLEPPSVREFNPQVSDEFESVIAHCLAKKAEGRFSNLMEIVDSLPEGMLQAKPAAQKEEKKNTTSLDSWKFRDEAVRKDFEKSIKKIPDLNERVSFSGNLDKKESILPEFMKGELQAENVIPDLKGFDLEDGSPIFDFYTSSHSYIPSQNRVEESASSEKVKNIIFFFIFIGVILFILLNMMQ